MFRYTEWYFDPVPRTPGTILSLSLLFFLRSSASSFSCHVGREASSVIAVWRLFSGEFWGGRREARFYSVCTHIQSNRIFAWKLPVLIRGEAGGRPESIYLWLYSPFCWILAAFSVSWFYTQSAGLGREISLSQAYYLQTEQHKHRIIAHNTDIHAWNGIRTHDPSVQVSEGSSCLDSAATLIGKARIFSTKLCLFPCKDILTDWCTRIG
jgi:hypothetical protein